MGGACAEAARRSRRESPHHEKASQVSVSELPWLSIGRAFAGAARRSRRESPHPENVTSTSAVHAFVSSNTQLSLFHGERVRDKSTGSSHVSTSRRSFGGDRPSAVVVAVAAQHHPWVVISFIKWDISFIPKASTLRRRDEGSSKFKGRKNRAKSKARRKQAASAEHGGEAKGQ